MRSPSLDAIREACAWVADVAEHVRVGGDPAAYARSFDLARIARPTWDDAHHFVGPEPDVVAYVVALDTVNFGSGWFPQLRKRAGASGYFTLSTALADRFRLVGPLAATELEAMDAVTVAAIFGQGLDDPASAELMERFADAWRQLGGLLLERYDGSPCHLVEAAGGSAEGLLRILSRMPAFRDVSTYRGRAVPLYKRGQIMASDLALALGGRGLGAFHDLDRLTIFADDLVPHVLHVDGILAYRDDLRRQIGRGELLSAGSPPEVEIRAVAVHAVERMVQALRADGVAIAARDLDVALWNRGQASRYRELPRHRTRTVFY